ncbi:DUF4112 domain-containing protein [Alteromonas pelagimontana]|uniref:DUF4112 domain-containing protein n=1 Tax=Alteromonas pelagimontana TaxID=1858656 RepID=A0A6M4MDX4_9ALTE|nr:DUF4112 domain-containing protein [Alteromonas pelagimontana]QJR81391.1 DUF4112 domain-containing protein [Alteromonas pelagimontana]
MTSTSSQANAPKELLQAQRWANTLDSAFKLPFIPFRVGMDSIVGLVPGLGDAVMLLASLRIVWLGKKMGMPKALVTSMVRKSMIDFGIGFVPFVGDIADFFYKANRANVRTMEKWWVAQNKNSVDSATQGKLKAWEAGLSDA